jgi:hypothetical protein
MIYVKSLVSLLLSGVYLSDQTSAVGYLYSPPFMIDIQFTEEPYSTFSFKKMFFDMLSNDGIYSNIKTCTSQVSSVSASLWCLPL